MQAKVPVRLHGVGLVALAALCTSGAFSPVSLLSDGGPPEAAGWIHAGVMIPDVPAGQSWTVGMTTLCLTRAGSARLIGVEPVDASGGLEVKAFATGPPLVVPEGTLSVGTSLGGLADLVRGAGHEADPDNVRAASGLVVGGAQAVTGRCGVAAEVTQLVVEVSRPTAATATTEGIAVDYTVPGEPGTRRFVSPLRITLCGPSDDTSRYCGKR